MTTDGWRKKKAMSDSRFATLYEDPSYEDDWTDQPDEFLAEPWPDEDDEPLSPHSTINS